MFASSSAFLYVTFMTTRQGDLLAGLLGPEIVEGASCGSGASGSGSGSGSGTGTGTATGSGTSSGTGSSCCGC